jgi:hypothetical protein
MFTLKFDTDNDAFRGSPEAEIAHILREIAEKIEVAGLDEGAVYDSNGNRIGEWRYTS